MTVNFIGKKRKSCKFEETYSSSSSKKPVLEALEYEKMQFLNDLPSCPGAKPAVLAIPPGICDASVPESLAPELHIYLWYSLIFTSQIALV